MQDKIDVLICTKDPTLAHPKLIEVLNAAPWVDHIVYDTTKPLSWSRVVGAKKCSGEIIGMFDDDTVPTANWYPTVKKYMKPDVLAVSSPYVDVNIHMMAFEIISDRIMPLETRAAPFINNTLIRRDTLCKYRPVSTFRMDDEMLYRYVTSKGKWAHSPYCGVIHYITIKDAVVAGVELGQRGGYPLIRFAENRVARFVLPYPAIAYSRTWKTVPFFWNDNVRFTAGWLKGKTYR